MHLERLIGLLEIVAVMGRPVSVAEAPRSTDLPKPSCYRLIQTLIDQKLLDQPGGNAKVVIGERLIRIALLGKSDVDVRRSAAPLLKTAAMAINETVFLGRFRDGRVEIIHVETPQDPGRAFVHPGLGERPLHACSCSKAIAAFAEPAFQNHILSKSLKAYTEFTQTSEAELRAEFAEIVARGFADCDQEIDIGIASVAAPVMIGHVGASFSVGAGGPIRRFGTDYRHQIGEKMKSLSKKIAGAIQLSDIREIAHAD